MKKIGKYDVCGLLGRGGMGAVYKARLPVLGRIVALKLLWPHPNLVSVLGEDAVRDKFISEARRIASLRDPHIIEILDFDWYGIRPFFTMEYHYHDLGNLIGETYRAEMQSRILPVEKLVRYCRQILRGLAVLHRAGIVHRDIKPGNLLISDEDRIKICDFGFSRVRGEKPDNPWRLLVGSPFYAAPEQEKDPDSADSRADLYSTGVIVHRMLTGYLPEDGIRKPSRFHPDADPPWDGFIEKALAQDPDRRFQTASEMLSALDLLAAEYERKKELFCRYYQNVTHAAHEQSAGKKLRSVPVKVTQRDAPALFGCDPLMRPVFSREEEDNGYSVLGDLVIDRKNGLLWQRSGSEDRLDRDAAFRYVEDLNRTRFGNRSDWRLPTANELLSTLRRPGLGVEDCFPPAFDRSQKTIWTADRCTFISGWYVHMQLGFAGHADFTSQLHVRAVTDAEKPPGGMAD